LPLVELPDQLEMGCAVALSGPETFARCQCGLPISPRSDPPIDGRAAENRPGVAAKERVNQKSCIWDGEMLGEVEEAIAEDGARAIEWRIVGATTNSPITLEAPAVGALAIDQP
jgi:hypothetical protein